MYFYCGRMFNAYEFYSGKRRKSRQSCYLVYNNFLFEVKQQLKNEFLYTFFWHWRVNCLWFYGKRLMTFQTRCMKVSVWNFNLCLGNFDFFCRGTWKLILSFAWLNNCLRNLSLFFPGKLSFNFFPALNFSWFFNENWVNFSHSEDKQLSFSREN